ncbi:serine/threonine-protein kinase grp-like [Cryptotermes secundus]|uniref:serine/threonine-protein kinase grp-like n=1 Tax=Cryptotermes secundus TaxID=105785 RepID=UPI000CD7DF35|nr:serine/threonine-protein kinase grp-like [Cryptotermes secundus]
MQEEEGTLSFSQPAHLDDMVLNSQLHAAQPCTRTSSQNTFQILVQRMTCFCICTDYKETIEKLCKLLDKLSYTWRIAAKVLTVTTTDKCDVKLHTLADFRL